MKQFYTIKSLFLLGMVMLSHSLFAQTTYLSVGCASGPDNFPTLRAAFQWVEANSFPADIDISICPGVYPENAIFNAFPGTGPAHNIFVHSSTYNPVDVTIQPANASATRIFLLNGVKNVHFEAITIDFTTASTAGRRNCVRTQNGSGDIYFANCQLFGFVPGGGAYPKHKFALIEAKDWTGAFNMGNCGLLTGGMGVHFLSGAPTSTLSIQNSSITQISGDGILEDYPFLSTEINNSTIICGGNGNWNGITTQYQPNSSLTVQNSTIHTKGAGNCRAIQAHADHITLSDNQIYMANHYQARGIEVHKDAYAASITHCEIAYPGSLISTVRPDTFLAVTNLSTAPVVVTSQNKGKFAVQSCQIDCDGADFGSGIHFFAHFNLLEGISIDSNDIDLKMMGSYGVYTNMAVWISSHDQQMQNFQMTDNAITLETVSGHSAFGVHLSNFLHYTDAKIFHNVIQLPNPATNINYGLFLKDIRSDSGTSTLVGNNAIALSRNADVALFGLSFSVYNDCAIDALHNSVLLSGDDAGSTSYALSCTQHSLGKIGQINLIDNIFANTAGGLAIANSNYTDSWNYSESNCYYAPASTYLGKWGSLNIADLPALQAVTLADTQSVQVDPGFVGPMNLHLSSGSALWGVPGLVLSFTDSLYALNWDDDYDPRLTGSNREIGYDESPIFVWEPSEKTLTESVSPPFQLYPNPVRNQFTFEWEDHQQASIDWVDMSGRTVKSYRNQLAGKPIFLSGLAPGLYLLRLSDSGQTKIVRVTVQ